MKVAILLAIVLAGFLLFACNQQEQQNHELPRVIVLTDINNVGGDPDDKQSMAHLLMYANELDIRALIPDYWKGKGYEATMEAVEAYEKDHRDPAYAFQDLDYPHPDSIRNLVARNENEAISRIIKEAGMENDSPLYILVWGSMTTLKNALFEAPDIAGKIRVLTIATNLMADNPDSRKNAEVDQYCKNPNWNGRGRNDIFNDPRFDDLWWIENDWAYNGMFEGREPRDFLLEIKGHGNLGHHIWDVVQPKSFVH